MDKELSHTIKTHNYNDNLCARIITLRNSLPKFNMNYSNHIIYDSVETGSGHPGHPGHPGHIFSGSSGSDPVYNLSRSDPDWIT